MQDQVALGAQRSPSCVKGGIARAPGWQNCGSGQVAWAQMVGRSTDQVRRAWCKGRALLDFPACDSRGRLRDLHGRYALWASRLWGKWTVWVTQVTLLVNWYTFFSILWGWWASIWASKTL